MPKLFVRKPNQSALLHLLPLLWSLLNASGPRATVAVRSGPGLPVATARFACALYAQIGNDLLDAAAASSKVSVQARQALRSMIDIPV